MGGCVASHFQHGTYVLAENGADISNLDQSSPSEPHQEPDNLLQKAPDKAEELPASVEEEKKEKVPEKLLDPPTPTKQEEKVPQKVVDLPTPTKQEEKVPEKIVELPSPIKQEEKVPEKVVDLPTPTKQEEKVTEKVVDLPPSTKQEERVPEKVVAPIKKEEREPEKVLDLSAPTKQEEKPAENIEVIPQSKEELKQNEPEKEEEEPPTSREEVPPLNEQAKEEVPLPKEKSLEGEQKKDEESPSFKEESKQEEEPKETLSPKDGSIEIENDAEPPSSKNEPKLEEQNDAELLCTDNPDLASEQQPSQELDLTEEEVEGAVVKIQAGIRGYLTRKALRTTKEGSVMEEEIEEQPTDESIILPSEPTSPPHPETPTEEQSVITDMVDAEKCEDSQNTIPSSNPLPGEVDLNHEGLTDQDNENSEEPQPNQTVNDSPEQDSPESHEPIGEQVQLDPESGPIQDNEEVESVNKEDEPFLLGNQKQVESSSTDKENIAEETPFITDVNEVSNNDNENIALHESKDVHESASQEEKSETQKEIVLEELGDPEEIEEAVVKLQAGYRGFKARKEVKERKINQSSPKLEESKNEESINLSHSCDKQEIDVTIPCVNDVDKSGELNDTLINGHSLADVDSLPTADPHQDPIADEQTAYEITDQSEQPKSSSKSGSIEKSDEVTNGSSEVPQQES